jgi:dihydroorotase
MNDVMIRQARIVDPSGPHHDTDADVLISQGRIVRIGNRLPKGHAHELRLEGLHLSPGWLDLRAHFRDPGQEWKEGIANGLDAAAAGGFTAVCALPSTEPAIDGRAGVEYLQRKAEGHAVRLIALGALTKGLAGKQLAEMHDMRTAGAAAFTDDLGAVRNARLMLLALQYARGLASPAPPVMVHPHDPDLCAGAQMHEGPMSTRLGLRGMPAMAETTRLQRDIELLAYAGGHLHAACISTAGSVELIRQAKARKLRITASVAAHNLLLDDGCLRGFESCYKVMPPLRDPEHIAALREGVKDGTVDAIVSDHRPEDREHKVLELGQAAFGIIGLETAFAAANTAVKGAVSLRRIVERFAHGPRAVLGLPLVHIAEGAEADLTLFDPTVDWTCTEADLVSRSHNTPFIGQRFTGRPLGIIARGRMRWAPAFAEAMA